MKKIIASLTLTALAVMTFGPALAVATGDSVDTGLSRGTGGGSDPIVKVKWEMNDTKGTDGKWLGTDDSTALHSQFNAPGVWNGTMNYAVCAIVTDPNGVADIAGVYADIYYPEAKALHELNPSTDVHLDTAAGAQDVGQGACGAFIEENTLLQLSKTDGYELFCNKIKNNNNNLPKFFDAYNYSEICAADGELMKEKAYVYCDSKTLSYEDVAGDYKVRITAQDKAGNNSIVGQNKFDYLPFTGFERDFTAVSYGQVLLNTHQIISGDMTWGATTDPSIRNVGNTRLWMKVAQDDMALGQSSSVWNVQYDARVGNNEADWKIYSPFGFKPAIPTSGQYTQLEDILDLSEMEEMDFSILVTKWPDANTSYQGGMWLNAVPAPARICQAI